MDFSCSVNDFDCLRYFEYHGNKGSLGDQKVGKLTQDIEYTVQIWKEGNQFVAHAMPLDVMSSGRTPEEARKALAEAVHLFLMTAADCGSGTRCERREEW